EATGRNHPQRNCLTSAIIGETLDVIDCPAEPFDLEPGDVILAASDGLQFMPDAAIAGILRRVARSESRAVADALLGAIAKLADPEQDNTSVVVIRAEPVNAPAPQPAPEFSVGQMLRSILRSVTPAREPGTPRP
ncbi:MAG: hypothetical protein AAF914_10165, partial [Pseudomonadota bacterium]